MAEYIDIDQMVTVKDTRGREIQVSVRQILTKNFGKFEIADVVPVVRCKDCKHCQKDELFGGMWCRGERVGQNWFCPDGEKNG